jgi:hypothetical protein
MGGLISQQRYMKGMVPAKYYSTEMWPRVEDLFLKLGLEEQKGLELFLTFCRMDVDASGTVDVDECFEFLGGTRTKFTERIWFAEGRFNDEGQREIGHLFPDFAVIVWNFCTLTPYYMARLCFEIFDVDNRNRIERPDICTLYRLVYDCDEHDEYYVNQIELRASDGSISKDEFCEQVNRHRHIIEPCLSYQARLRRKMGGFIMWEALAGFRRRYFLPIDSNATTCQEALQGILDAEDPNRAKRKKAADELLAEQQRKAEAEEREAEAQIRAAEDAKEKRQREIEAAAEDRFMKAAWIKLEKKRFEFEDNEVSVERAWEAKERRDEIYALFDEFLVVAREYWEVADDKELKLTIGSDADHEARYRDFMRTPEGTLLRQRTVCRIALTEQVRKFEEEREKKKHKVTGLPKKKDIQTDVEGALDELERKALREVQIRTIKASGASRRVLEALKPVNYLDELGLVKQLCKRAYIKEVEVEARNEIFEARRKFTISSAEATLAKKKEDRERDYVRIEFEMAQLYGSRHTSYTKCRDYKNNRDVFVDTNTLSVLHIKTAICEKCDAIFQQSDKLCKGCNSRRSAKNQKLYRPLGFKDITLDDGT